MNGELAMSIHVEECTPPNSREKLYTVWYNGNVMMECVSFPELLNMKLGELWRAWIETR